MFIKGHLRAIVVFVLLFAPGLGIAVKPVSAEAGETPICAPTPTCISGLQFLTDTEIGAQGFPDLSFAVLPPRNAGSRIRYVTTDGNDSWDGTTRATAWRTPEHAAAMATQGQVVYIYPGTYYSWDIHTHHNGSRTQPIWFMAAPGAPTGSVVIMPPNPSSTYAPGISIENDFWVVSGIEIRANGQLGPGLIFNNCQWCVAKHMHIWGGTGSEGVAFVGAHDSGLFTSHVDHYRWPEQQDSHGILVQPGSEHIVIGGNEVDHNQADAFQCADSGEAGPGQDSIVTPTAPHDIWVINNRFHEDGENAVDVKSCSRLTIGGNKFYGYTGVPSDHSGAAIVVHVRASSVLIQNNRIWNSGIAASIGSIYGSDAGQLGPIVFRRNLVFDASTKNGSPGDGLHADQVLRNEPRAVAEIYDNTFYHIPNYAISLGYNGTSNQVTIVNNIFDDTRIPIHVSTPNLVSLISDNNVFWPVREYMFMLNNGYVNQTEWQRVYDFCSRFNNPLFIDDPRHNDFYTQPASPAQDFAGPDPTNSAYCGSGPDAGFLETCYPLGPNP